MQRLLLFSRHQLFEAILGRDIDKANLTIPSKKTNGNSAKGNKIGIPAANTAPSKMTPPIDDLSWTIFSMSTFFVIILLTLLSIAQKRD